MLLPYNLGMALAGGAGLSGLLRRAAGVGLPARKLRPKLLLLCTLSLVACASEQEKRAAEDRLRETLVATEVAGATGGEVIAPPVECSDQIDADKGDRFACTVTAPDRTSVVVKAMQTDDNGGGRLLTKLLDTREVQGQLEGRIIALTKNNDRVALFGLVDCPDLVVVKEGARFTCRGAYKVLFTTQNFKLRATFTDDRGGFTYTIPGFHARRFRSPASS